MPTRKRVRHPEPATRPEQLRKSHRLVRAANVDQAEPSTNHQRQDRANPSGSAEPEPLSVEEAQRRYGFSPLRVLITWAVVAGGGAATYLLLKYVLGWTAL